jgi:SAM-dependent methyltransferase
MAEGYSYDTTRHSRISPNSDDMPTKTEADVPSPIDLRTMKDAQEWADTVSVKRPWRQDFFSVFAEELHLLPEAQPSVLELGSGPGFLAQHLLMSLIFAHYTALDFSDAMHALARARLGDLSDRVEFLTRDFLLPHWSDSLTRYSAVVTLQSVHELRHKRRAPVLYQQVRSRLSDNGVFLVCDHFSGSGGMSNTALFMSLEEHEDALREAGFGSIRCLLNKGGMVLYRAKSK